MLASCVMPVADRPGLIDIAIRGFQDQTVEDIELLILDDGNDPSIAADKIKDPRIQYIRMSPGHVPTGEKLNRLCEIAKAPIVIRMDSDDFSCPNRVEKQLSTLIDTDVDLTGSAYIFLYDFINKKASIVEPKLGTGGSSKHPLFSAYGATFAFRRAYWARHKFLPVTIGEDLLFWKIAWESRRARVVTEYEGPWIVVGRHPKNTVRDSRIANSPLEGKKIPVENLPVEFLAAIGSK
jgi:glycosyltransferase involved in cell wall biosynthesis